MAAAAAASGNGAKTAVRPPEGLARVGSVANAPWWHLKNVNVLSGVLENMYSRPDERSKSGRSNFFQVRLLAPTEVRFGRGKDAKVGTAKVGDVINLNYGPKTKEFENFISNIMQGAEYEVWCHIDGEKFDIGKGQTMWPIDVRAVMRKAPTVSTEPDFGDDDDDAPEAGAKGAASAS